MNAATELDISTDRRISDLKSAVLRTLQIAKSSMESWKPAPHSPVPPLPAADLTLIEKANAEFRQNFIWQSGDFHLRVEVETDKGSFESRSYRFTVFESMEVSLTNQVQGYAMGHGLLPDLPINGVTTKLRASA